jgi:pimeloyl-ACP methyl ester carboxylesterase
MCYKLAALPGASKALITALRSGINLCGQRSKLTKALLSDLKNIHAPTLIVWGEHDRIIPLAHAHITAAKIPGSRLEIFGRCGHVPMFEYPEKFNQLVLDFLTE